MNFSPDISIVDRMVQIRRTLHQYPELAYEEKETSSLIMAELNKLSIAFKSGIAKTGIIAVIEPAKNSARKTCVALRADMDALPVQEETGLPFSSKNKGVMHACGHDGHMAMLLGAASILKRMELPGKVVLIFQPAEEAGNGAAKIVEQGGLEGVQMVFGGHIDTHYQVGFMTIDPGLVCSYVDPFIIKIHGRGGHAARPHEAVDSIVIASNLIMNMQTLISRRIDPNHASVVTVGKIVAGTVNNVIAEQAILEGTVRSSHSNTRERILNCLRRFVQGASDMYDAQIELNFLDGLPAVENDVKATLIAHESALYVVGKEGVISQGSPSLGGEDFSFYQQRIPGCLIRYGAALDSDKVGPAHSGRFDFDEKVLTLGAEWLARVAVQGLYNMEKEPLIR